MTVAHVGNSLVIGLQELANNLTGAAIEDATVEVTLLDTLGNEVAGETWPVTAAAGTDADGVAGFYAVLSHQTALVSGRHYLAVVDAVDNVGGAVGQWRVPLVAFIRTG